MTIYNITPVAAPRMTQRDKWAKRPCVQKYFAFRYEVKLHKVWVPESGAQITFYIPMPKSWSKKKKREMEGKPHQQRPDLDNLCKALLDGIYGEDCFVWQLSASKVWSVKGAIEVIKS